MRTLSTARTRHFSLAQYANVSASARALAWTRARTHTHIRVRAVYYACKTFSCSVQNVSIISPTYYKKNTGLHTSHTPHKTHLISSSSSSNTVCSPYMWISSMRIFAGARNWYNSRLSTQCAWSRGNTVVHNVVVASAVNIIGRAKYARRHVKKHVCVCVVCVRSFSSMLSKVSI